MWGAEREFSRGETQYKIACPNCKQTNLVYKIPYEAAEKANAAVNGVVVPGEKAVQAASEPKVTRREETKKNKEERKAKRAEKGH